MTEEKRKRGRPRKVAIEITAHQSHMTIALPQSPMDGEVVEIQLSKPGTIIAKRPEEQSYPSNWNEMGKVDRLKWLTEHRK
jgi:hypothetical protein